MAIEEKKFLGTAGVQQLITNIRGEFYQSDDNVLNAAEQYAKNYADGLADNYDAAGTAATKVQELADGQVKTNTEHIGVMDNLETTAKSDLVNAINEVRNAVSAGGTAAAITMTENTTGLGEGVLKSYTIKQGENTVGTINIPKDMVVQSGEVVVNPEGQAAGTYIKLVLANATNDEIFVNVGTLVDIYKAKASAAQVQLAIDSATREISASIVAGSITATELAADSVVTAKIADGNVTKAKLSTEVQASLDKADVAEANAKSHANDLNSAMNTRVEALEAIDHDHSNKAELDLIATGDKAKWDSATGKAHEHSNKSVLDGITSAKVSAWDSAESNAKAYAKEYADGKDEAIAAAQAKADQGVTDAAAAQADVDALEKLVGTTSVQSQINTAITNLDLGNTYATKTEAQGYADAKDSAIAEAKKAGTDAQTAVNTLETGKVATLRTDVDALMSVSYVEITASEINAMFYTEQ